MLKDLELLIKGLFIHGKMPKLRSGLSNLVRIAIVAGYTLEELLAYLEGHPVEKPSDVDKIVNQVKTMPLKQLALVGKAVTDRLEMIAESTGAQ